MLSRLSPIRRSIIHYASAVVAVGLGLLLRLVLVRFVGELPTYITFYPAVMVVALLGGVGAGLAATVLSALAVVYWVLMPRGLFMLHFGETSGVALFLGMGVFMSLVAGFYRQARSRIAAYQAELAVQTECARAARETERQRLLLEVTLTSIGDAVIVTDAQGFITFLNREAERLTGWTHADALCQPLPTVFRIVNEQTRETAEDPVCKVLRLGAVIGLANHTVLISKDDRQIPIDDSGAPVRLPDGTIQGVVLVFRDFTQYRQAERALKESEERFRMMADAIPQLAWMAQADGYIFWYNGRWFEYTGTTLEQMQGWGWESLHDPAVLPRVMERWKASITTHQPFDMEFPLRGADGRFRWFLTRVMPLKDASGRVVRWFGTSTDISEKREAEEALRESELFYRQTLESIPGMVFTTRADGYCDYQSQQWVDYTGVPVSEHLGDGWNRLLHPDDRPRAYAAWRAAVEGSAPYDLEYRVRRHDGEYEWFKVIGRPILDGSGQIVRWFGTAVNIQELKRAELSLNAAKVSAEQAKAVAEQAKAVAEEASAAKDRFLAVLSHELRTPLTPVLAAISMAQKRTDQDIQPMLDMIRRNIELEARLIDDLLDLTRISKGKIQLNKQQVDLSTIIERAVEVCRPDIEARRLHFGVDIGPGAPYMIEADPAHMQQVFWNLLKNAIKFTPHDGCVGVRCRPDQDGYVVVEVNDSGAGIKPHAIGRIFDAFAQADAAITRQFGGLGLGLAISRSLVEMHGGTIEAYSEGTGKGSSFRVRLPLLLHPGMLDVADVNEPQSRLAEGDGQRTRPLRILLVEDHGDTAAMMQVVLEDEGHQVQHAGDVTTAMELASAGSFDLLVSDLGLPDGSGIDLMRGLRARGNNLPGIALSGYGQDQDVQLSRNAGFAVHVTKPADIDRLLAAIVQIASPPCAG